jgi:transcriptional regulator with XRE-family HTH domain
MNYPLYRSLHVRGLTQEKLSALTGIERSVLARILTNQPGRGKQSRQKIIPHLTPEEIEILGWQVEQSSTSNIVPSEKPPRVQPIFFA